MRRSCQGRVPSASWPHIAQETAPISERGRGSRGSCVIGRRRKPRSNLVAINERERAVMDANVNDPLAATGPKRDNLTSELARKGSATGLPENAGLSGTTRY